METVTGADGVTIALRRERGFAGHAELTVLLLHGWPGTSADWDLVVDALPAAGLSDADVVVPDLRGFGVSGRPTGDDPARYGPAAHVADLRAVLDDVSATRVVVAGYDLGATLAQQLSRVDGRVTGVVLGCPAYAGIGERRFEPAVQAELWYQQLHLQPWAADLVARDRATVEVYLRHFYTHWWGETVVDETRFQAVVDAYAQPGAIDASIGWYRARAGTRSADAARTVAAGPLEQPTVVLWGDRDPVVPIRFADRLDEFFARLTFTPLPGVGHFIPLEAPQATAAAIAAAAAGPVD